MRGTRHKRAGICFVQTHGEMVPRPNCPRIFESGMKEGVVLVTIAIDRCQHISSLNIIVPSNRDIDRPKLQYHQDITLRVSQSKD